LLCVHDRKVALIAYLVFGEVPVIWTWIGGLIIAASSLYITLREARLRREAVAGDDPEPSP
jgi:drug/metabolite transporter (DMT)-like permease